VSTQAQDASLQAQDASLKDSQEGSSSPHAGEPHIDAHGRARRIRTLDFSQPTKFTTEFRRQIARVLGPFCETVANRLSSELRAQVELRVTDSSQLTWSAARAQLPAQSVAVALQVRPIERQMLLEIEQPMLLQSLECLLGGTAAQAPTERRLSEIDWALTRGILDAIVGQLAMAWRDLGGLELSYGQVDVEGDAGVFAPIGEPTFLLTFECRIDGERSGMSLLIPWSAIEPVAGEILGAEGTAHEADPREQQAVQRGLAEAQVLLRAEVGSRQMPVEEMLALTPGATLTLEGRAEDGVALYAEGVALGRGRPGLRGTRRAIKLTSTMAPAAGGRLSSTLGAAAAGKDGKSAENAQGDEEEGLGRARQTERGLGTLERMLGVPVRVWAELGRTHMPLGHALEMPPGTVVELEQSVDTPIELFAGGLPFAHGTLLVSAEGEWAVQVQKLI
jgi:flagellar motor switch protein FliM